MPRPRTTPVRGTTAFGDGRASQFAAFAASSTISRKRASRRWRTRYSTGSALTCDASSSMKHSCAKVFCSRAGDRSGPVQNGETTLCNSTRSLLTLPVPLLELLELLELPTRPATYEGTPLLLLLNEAGAGAGDLGLNGSGSK